MSHKVFRRGQIVGLLEESADSTPEDGSADPVVYEESADSVIRSNQDNGHCRKETCSTKNNHSLASGFAKLARAKMATI